MNYEALDESIEYLELVSEGVNTELWAESKKINKKFKSAMKEAKACLKKRQFKEAKGHIAEGRKAVEEYAKFVDKTKADHDDVGEAIGGYFLGCLNNFGRVGLQLAICLGGAVAGGVAGGLAGGAAGHAINKASGGIADSLLADFEDLQDFWNESAVVTEGLKDVTATAGASLGSYIGAIPGSIMTIIKGIILTIKDIKNIVVSFRDKKENAVDALNYYRQQCKTAAQDYALMLKKLEAACDKLEKETNAVKK